MMQAPDLETGASIDNDFLWFCLIREDSPAENLKNYETLGICRWYIGMYYTIFFAVEVHFKGVKIRLFSDFAL